MDPRTHSEPVQVRTASVTLDGVIAIPRGARGIVAFAHGSGSGLRSARNTFVAESLQKRGLATLLFDLLTVEEKRIDAQTRHLRFDIELLSQRLEGATEWLLEHRETRGLCVGYFGASTGAAAALTAAVSYPDVVKAVVCRGGRPDLSTAPLPEVAAPTLLIVGGNDPTVLDLNRDALAQLRGEKRLRIIERATHLFEEPGALEQVADAAGAWFERFLFVLP